MTETFKPADEQQLQELIAWAAAEAKSLDLAGSGSKRALGRPVEAVHAVDLSAIAGIVDYQPSELLMVVRPGTPLDEIEARLEGNGQMLAYEPPDWGWVLDGASAPGTIGGTIAVGGAGPRRILAGGARDHLLGARAVSGRGEVFVSGGKVVKNVTGYDLPKLLTGSYGTLAAFSELNLKVLPKPEKAYTLLLYGLGDAQAIDAMRLAAQSPYEISAAAHLPADMGARSTVSYVSDPQKSVIAIRLEGPHISVTHRLEALRSDLAEFGDMEELHSANSRTLWAEVRDARLLPADDQMLWRVSVPTSCAAAVLASARPDAHIMDWAGGLLWLSFAVADETARIRIAAGMTDGGHATLIRAPEALRRSVPVFEPQPEPLAKLSARVKESFDPKGILSPGRMVEGV